MLTAPEVILPGERSKLLKMYVYNINFTEGRRKTEQNENLRSGSDKESSTGVNIQGTSITNVYFAFSEGGNQMESPFRRRKISRKDYLMVDNYFKLP